MKYVRRKELNKILAKLEKGYEVEGEWLVDLEGNRIITVENFLAIKK